MYEAVILKSLKRPMFADVELSLLGYLRDGVRGLRDVAGWRCDDAVVSAVSPRMKKEPCVVVTC